MEQFVESVCLRAEQILMNSTKMRKNFANKNKKYFLREWKNVIS